LYFLEVKTGSTIKYTIPKSFLKLVNYSETPFKVYFGGSGFQHQSVRTLSGEILNTEINKLGSLK